MFFFKFLSRSVHDDREEHQELLSPGVIRIQGTCKSLTVWRKSLIISCNGFTVIDSDGNLVFRVDNYVRHHGELILMDGSGKSIFTMRRRQKFTLTESWEVYEGEVGGGDQNDASESTRSSKKPVCCVKKSNSIFHGNSNVLAYVYKGSSGNQNCATFVIEGSYAQRSCKMVDEAKRVVAEVKRKDAMIGGISFGTEVFLLVVQPGFAPGFAMALVLLLDQMFS